MFKLDSADDRGRTIRDVPQANIMREKPPYRAAWTLAIIGAIGSGCTMTAPKFSASPRYTDGPAPLREQGPGRIVEAKGFEAEVTGGELYKMYCAYCHVRRQLSERPFSNTQNVFAHMRSRVSLTGVEYEKLIDWLQKIDDVPSGTPAPEPSPKRLIYSQPISELKPTEDAPVGDAPTVPANPEPANPPPPPA